MALTPQNVRENYPNRSMSYEQVAALTDHQYHDSLSYALSQQAPKDPGYYRALLEDPRLSEFLRENAELTANDVLANAASTGEALVVHNVMAHARRDLTEGAINEALVSAAANGQWATANHLLHYGANPDELSPDQRRTLIQEIPESAKVLASGGVSANSNEEADQSLSGLSAQYQASIHANAMSASDDSAEQRLESERNQRDLDDQMTPDPYKK